MIRVRPNRPLRVAPPILLAAWLALAVLRGAPAAADSTLEVRGILVVGGQPLFCIRDAEKKSSVWVQLDESGHDFVVKRFDPATDTLTVEQRSRTFTLTLRGAKTAPASDREILHAMIATAPVSADGTDLDPPRWIRDALKNDSLTDEDIKRYLDERLHRTKPPAQKPK